MKVILTESQILRVLNEEYSEKVIRQLVDKFKEEDPNEDTSVIRSFIKRFDDIKGDSKILDKDIFNYSLEKLRDVIYNSLKSGVKPKSYKGNSDLDLVYDNNDNIKIYVADTREKCITYGKGYSFCISSYSDTASYKKHRMIENGTPYFVFNSKLSKNYDKHEGFLDPDHLLVVFIHLNWENSLTGNRYYYTVTDANNTGEVTYEDYESIVSKYPFLKGLKEIFKPINLSKKEKDLLHLHTFSSSMFARLNSKYDNLFRTSPKQQFSGGFKDGCGNRLPFIHSHEDLTLKYIKPIFDLFKEGYQKSYTAFFRGNKGGDRKIVGLTTHQECEEAIKKEIEIYTKEYNNLLDNPFWNSNKSDSLQLDNLEMKRYMMDEKNYGIAECEWPPLYIDYLKEVYALSVKIMHEKWTIEKTQYDS